MDLNLDELVKLQGKSVGEVIDALNLKGMSREDLEALKVDAENRIKEIQAKKSW